MQIMQDEDEMPQSWQMSEEKEGGVLMAKRPGLYANIHAKRKSGRPMRRAGSKGAPTNADFRRAAKTAKPKTRKT